MVDNTLTLDLVRILGTRASPHEVGCDLSLIELTHFSKLPANWGRSGEERILVTGRCGRGEDYMFYKPHVQRAIGYDEAYHLFRAPRERLPVGHPTGWDFHAIAAIERECDGETAVGRGIHDVVMYWGNEVEVDEVVGVGEAVVFECAEDRAQGESGSSAAGDGVDGGSASQVPRGPRANIGFSASTSPSLSRSRGRSDDNDFTLMFTRMFVAEVVREDIPRSVIEGRCDQLGGYMRGRLDR